MNRNAFLFLLLLFHQNRAGIDDRRQQLREARCPRRLDVNVVGNVFVRIALAQRYSKFIRVSS
jgi:hypothetical protein